MSLPDSSPAPAPKAPHSAVRTGGHRRLGALLAVLGILALLVLGTLGFGLAARRAYLSSFGSSLPLEQRAESASRAHWLAPWNTAYARRSQLLADWVLGKQQLERGDYNAAVNTLDRAYRLDVGNQELLALYRKAQDTQALATNRKAHLQHGHEGPGGTLKPGDVER